MPDAPARDNFVEVCIYEVKADKTDEFEILIRKVLKHHGEFPGVVDVRYVKRTHRSVDFGGARRAEPAIQLTRAPNAVTYILYWEIADKFVHAEATNLGWSNSSPSSVDALSSLRK